MPAEYYKAIAPVYFDKNVSIVDELHDGTYNKMATSLEEVFAHGYNAYITVKKGKVVKILIPFRS